MVGAVFRLQLQRLHLGQRHGRDRPVAVGCAVHAAIMHEHKSVIAGMPDVQLDPVLAQPEGGPDGRHAVLGGDATVLSADAAMADHESLFAVQIEDAIQRHRGESLFRDALGRAVEQARCRAGNGIDVAHDAG